MTPQEVKFFISVLGNRQQLFAFSSEDGQYRMRIDKLKATFLGRLATLAALTPNPMQQLWGHVFGRNTPPQRWRFRYLVFLGKWWRKYEGAKCKARLMVCRIRRQPRMYPYNSDGCIQPSGCARQFQEICCKISDSRITVQRVQQERWSNFAEMILAVVLEILGITKWEENFQPIQVFGLNNVRLVEPRGGCNQARIPVPDTTTTGGCAAISGNFQGG